MRHRILATLLYTEWLSFKREKSLLLFTLLLLAAGFYGIYSGHAEISRQRTKLAGLEQLYQDNISEMNAKYPDGADAGDIGYYHSAFARNLPDSWAALSIGQRDANPYYIKLRLLAVQNQLYNSENTNPDKLASGTFDLAFVLVYILPLFIVAICFNIYSAEKERGTLGSILSQPVSLSALLFAKFLFRFLLILTLVIFLSLVGISVNTATADSRLWLWIGGTVLYSLFWLGVCYVIVVLKKNSAFNAVSLLGLWLLFTVIMPVTFNVIIQIRQPLSEGLQLTLKQREEVHAGWDRPKEQTMQRFFTYYPKYRNTPEIGARFEWKWYYAFQELGDRSVDSLYKVYSHKLKSRSHLTSELSKLSPPATFQLFLNALCGTDIRAQLDFMESAVQYHNKLKAFYYPYLFYKKPFLESDFAFEPRHAHQSVADRNAIYPALIAMLIAFLAVLFAGAVLQLLVSSEIR
ncbi:ABC transporter permease [Desertivirga xinjiangensis]|uniref:ABC transporter permease n=1 Tax=Desertivirga xinjiangensis TaxID=539206 RepID=UPI00210C3A5A|nr:DUF3526 domain-containing protein [Pedobacter xinjiangensis]